MSLHILYGSQTCLISICWGSAPYVDMTTEDGKFRWPEFAGFKNYEWDEDVEIIINETVVNSKYQIGREPNGSITVPSV